MLPKRFLHYEVIDRVFSSGMSEVYKVSNLKLAGRVEALKLLSEKHRKNKDVYQRFRQEAEILSSLNHRCIPVIYEINEFKSRPFITMEFVDGKSLLDLTEYKILSLGRVIAISLEVISALNETHKSSIIHRDLKLSNIMITHEGEVKIIDFGLAAAGWNTPEKDEGVIIGTVPYMSPEQTRGERLDQRTDIFSMGICLYELLSGRLPFFDPDASEIIRRVRKERPRSIREQRPEVPDLLEKCVFQCIEKEPDKRFQNLDDLASVLDEVESYLKERGETASGEEASRGRMDTLTIDMVSREHEYGLLAQAYFRSISGKGTTVFIQGEAGVGKTRLIEEFAKQCSSSQIYMASGQAHPGVTIPYRPAAEAIRYLLLSCGVVTDKEIGEFIDTRHGHGSVQSKILRSFLLYTPSKNLEIAARENLFDTVSDLLAGFAKRAPLVIILENIHWADRATLDLIMHLTESIKGRRIMLAATFRTSEPGKEPGYPMKLFEGITEAGEKSGNAVLINLARLNREETENLINFYFPGNRFNRAFHKRIFDDSDGNPLFILELLKLFARLGIVSRGKDGWVQSKGKEDFPVPTRIHDLITRRLGSLGEKEMRVLEAAAVEGVTFTSGSVCSLVGIDRLTVLNILRSLWRQHLIDLKGESYRFNPPLVREVVYRRMMPELKREYHRSLADLYTDSPPPGKGYSADIARHFHLGGEVDEAIKHYMTAGFSALNLHADMEALEYFDSALELLEKTPLGPGVKTAMDIHLNRSEIFIRMGKPEKARDAADEAMTLAQAMGLDSDMGSIFRIMGKICHLNGNPKEAESHLENALSQIRSSSEKAEILNLLGLTAENRGDHKTAMNCFTASLAVSRAEENRLREAQTLNNMGRTFLNKGGYSAALARFKKALEITEEIGDRRGTAVNTNNVGILLRRMDRLEQSLKLLFRTVRVFKEIRYPNGTANTLRNIGTVFLAMGERKRAEKYILKANRIFEQISSRHGASICQISLGNILSTAGEVDKALEHIARSLDLGENISYPRIIAYGLAGRGSLELNLGLIKDAGESLEAALKAAKECGDLYLIATILGHMGLTRYIAGRNREGAAIMQSALIASEKSGDPVALRETLFFLSRTKLMEGQADLAEKHFIRGSTYISRNARSSRKAALYLESGLLEYHRKRPLQAYRKLETSFNLHREIGHSFKMLECLHGLFAALAELNMNERLRQYAPVKEKLMQALEASIPSPGQQAVFREYHDGWGALGFMKR